MNDCLKYCYVANREERSFANCQKPRGMWDLLGMYPQFHKTKLLECIVNVISSFILCFSLFKNFLKIEKISHKQPGINDSVTL